jgi:hypothetical protein
MGGQREYARMFSGSETRMRGRANWRLDAPVP